MFHGSASHLLKLSYILLFSCLFMDVIDAKNILNVKVLFLNNISLGNLCPIYQEPWDFLSSRFFEFCFSNGTNFMDFPDLTLAEALRVPDNLTTNYLGNLLLFFELINFYYFLVIDLHYYCVILTLPHTPL